MPAAATADSDPAATADSDPAAAADSDRAHDRRPTGRALVAPTLLAVAPLVAAGLRIAFHRPRIDWTGDRALTELAVRQAAGLHQLVGMGARFGWRHPGPLWIYLLVPGYEVSGHAPWALSVGAILIHVALIAVAVVAVGKAAGLRAAAVLSALCAVAIQSTGLVYWTNLWAGYAFAWPVVTLIVLAAVGTSQRDSGWALPAALLVGTLLVQTDVSTVVVVAFVGITAVVLRLARFGAGAFLAGPPRRPLRSRRPLRPPGQPAHARGGLRGPVSGAAVLALVIVLLAWLPPVVQQLSAHPGNITLLARFGRHPAGGYPLRTALAATGAALSVIPGTARWVLLDGVQRHLGPGPWWAVVLALAYLAGTSAASALAWRRGRRIAGDLSVLSFAALVAAVVAISRVDGPINFYLLTWIALMPVPALAGAILAIAPSRQVPGRVDPLPAAALVIAALYAVWLIGHQSWVHNWDHEASTAVATESARVEQALGPPGRGRVRIHILTADTWPDAAGVAVQLQRRGATIEVDPDWVFLFGDAFRPASGHRPAAEVWFARAHELPALSAETHLVDLGAVRGVTVEARR